MLSEEQILLIKRTWRMLKGIEASVVAGAFYAKLFSEHPGLKRLFPKDMEPQYIKLMDMLNAIVLKLDRLDQYAEELATMAQRHAGYGVKTEHYKMVGNALLWTLEKGLGKDWTPPVREAWKEAYRIISETMIESSSGKPVMAK
jgi:nitric oxide dioxygenase